MKKYICASLLLLLLNACSRGGYYLDGGIYEKGDNAAVNDGYMVDGDTPEGGTDLQNIKENPFVDAAEEPVSTFSVDADGASYAMMRRCIRNGQKVSAASVRIEEFLNYFTFDYPEPEGEETLAINAETDDCPWNEEHHLLRLGIKGKSLPDSQIPAANYIFLVDVSGSMSGPDRIELVKTGLCSMIDYMRPQDRIAIITYSGSVKMLCESTLLSEGADALKKAIRGLQASGSTAGGAAMKMAYDEASAHYVPGGNNRIIMCTDGDFNVGVSSTDELVAMVESYREQGIYLSIMGFGWGNYQDSRMENISNHGNGTYTYIDSEEEMVKVFVNERSRFWAVASDTKCQVRFNPEAIRKYRLIGYENRMMSKEDFEDSKKDAGEIGAGQTITALYEIDVKDEDFLADDSSPVLFTFEVRYKKSLQDAESRSLSLQHWLGMPGSENIQFAAGVTAFGLCLLDSQYKGEASFSMARDLVGATTGEDPLRLQLLELIDKAGSLY